VFFDIEDIRDPPIGGRVKLVVLGVVVPLILCFVGLNRAAAGAGAGVGTGSGVGRGCGAGGWLS
jgi:hypothetical protein